MKALIIGAAGFVGRHLIDELANRDWKISATKLPFEQIESNKCDVFDLDILSEEAICELLKSDRPDIVYHVAAQSSVALSWEKPALTVDVNIKGAINLLESIKKMKHQPRTVLIGSGEEYGAVKSDHPIGETVHPNPKNVYAITKLTQNLVGVLYAEAHRLDIVLTRAFNHIGPGQSQQFVAANFCSQVAAIEAEKKEPVIHVGNLNAKRDFTDVRDIVKAYALLGAKGISGETYNIGSGKPISIGELLDLIISLSKADITVEQDKSRMRPTDTPIMSADISKISKLGWVPEIPLRDTLKHSLDYWREKLNG